MSRSDCKGRVLHEGRAKPTPEALNEGAKVLLAQKSDLLKLLTPVLALGLNCSDCPWRRTLAARVRSMVL